MPQTDVGAKALKSNLLAPLTDPVTIYARQDFVVSANSDKTQMCDMDPPIGFASSPPSSSSYRSSSSRATSAPSTRSSPC